MHRWPKESNLCSQMLHFDLLCIVMNAKLDYSQKIFFLKLPKPVAPFTLFELVEPLKAVVPARLFVEIRCPRVSRKKIFLVVTFRHPSYYYFR